MTFHCYVLLQFSPTFTVVLEAGGTHACVLPAHIGQTHAGYFYFTRQVKCCTISITNIHNLSHRCHQKINKMKDRFYYGSLQATLKSWASDIFILFHILIFTFCPISSLQTDLNVKTWSKKWSVILGSSWFAFLPMKMGQGYIQNCMLKLPV